MGKAQNPANFYFCRTYDRQEIDWIEEREGHLLAFEMKWKQNKKKKAPGAWTKHYPDAEFQFVTPDNFRDWVL